MTEENIDAEKKDNQPQDKAADERLTDEQLDNVAGGGEGGMFLDALVTSSGRRFFIGNVVVAGGEDAHAIEDVPKLVGSPSGK